jgi:ubiquinone biosynthesis protein
MAVKRRNSGEFRCEDQATLRVWNIRIYGPRPPALSGESAPVEPSPLRLIRNLGRTFEIVTVLANYGFGDLLERLHLRRYVNWGRRLILRKKKDEIPEGLTTAQRIRMALQDLGPTFIKFGQVLSTRPDLIPQELIDELANLQEHVPPFDSAAAAHCVERELHGSIDSLFARFESEPLAAGSLAQVHRAMHPDGTPLAVKIRRPNAVRFVERDLALMADLAMLVERHIPEYAVFDPVGLVNHFSRTIRRELNFRREGRTVDEFRRLFSDDATLYVPRIYDDLTTEAVLTMEFIEGCRADDFDELAKYPITKPQLAVNGAHIFLKQAFEFGVFHGDPHPGNIRVRKDGSIALLDFGMIGQIDQTKREQLTDLLLSVERQNVDRMVMLAQEIGTATQPIDEVLLRADIRDFAETYYGLPLEKLKVGSMLMDLVSILANHGLRLPSDLLLLIRAFVTLEGLGRSLDPSFNMAVEVAPFAERLVKERYSARRMFERATADAREMMQTVHDLPLQAREILRKVAEDDLQVNFEHRGLDRLITEFDRSSNRVVVGVITGSLILASAIVIRTGVTSPWITVPPFLLSGFLGLWLIYGILRSGRL